MVNAKIFFMFSAINHLQLKLRLAGRDFKINFKEKGNVYVVTWYKKIEEGRPKGKPAVSNNIFPLIG